MAGFLAGYSGRTREATLDLRTFYRWCDQHRLGLFEVTRTQIELYARELEELGRAPATIGRRSDGFHPNARGYRDWADAFVEALRDELGDEAGDEQRRPPPPAQDGSRP